MVTPLTPAAGAPNPKYDSPLTPTRVPVPYTCVPLAL